jgi:hypothetical protein
LTVSPTSTALSGNRYRAVFTNAQGSATTNAATLTVTAPANLPVVSSVFPRAGFSFFFVFVQGRNFNDVREVDFGGRKALFARLSSCVIVALAPPHAPGTVHITVRTGTGTSAISPADQFRYLGWGW